MRHAVKASSFADPKDIAAYKKAKAKGMSDEDAFKTGDNGIGCWGSSTVEGTGPSCALPPDYMKSKWGSINAAKHKKVLVQKNERVVVCTLKDRMPWVKNLHNAARIDLNPDAVAALGLKPPIMTSVEWSWV
jgi:hypothetical protein